MFDQFIKLMFDRRLRSEYLKQVDDHHEARWEYYTWCIENHIQPTWMWPMSDIDYAIWCAL
jgi:hypothetical protein